MTKTQKIWMWFFIAMFAVPEILWSPVVNFIYIFISNSDPAKLFRINFLTEAGPSFLYRLIVLLQLIGLLGFLFILIKNLKKTLKRWQFYILLTFDLVLILLALFVFYLITILNISFP